MDYQRRPLGEYVDGYNPINGVYDDGTDGGISRGRRKKGFKKTRKRRTSYVIRRKRNKGLFGIFRRKRRVRRGRRVRGRGRGNGGIRYTKNGQPYKIMPNGRARFIKKKGGAK